MSDINNIQINDVNYAILDEELTDINTEITDVKQDLAEYEQIFTADLDEAVSNWLDLHPEATTSVEDHSLTYEKLVNGTLGFVTPEMYGAKGDGITDDTESIQNALDSGFSVLFFNKTYKCGPILIENTENIVLVGNNTTLYFPDATDNKKWFSFVDCSNVNISGIQFYGNRENQTIKRISDGVDGKDVTENCPAILFDHVVNGNIHNCYFNDTQGDGIQIDKIYYNQTATSVNMSDSIFITSCKFEKCGRNGISVVHGKNVVISNNEFINIRLYSTSIACAVDVEPNPVSGFYAENVSITDNVVNDCLFGIAVACLGSASANSISIGNNNIYNVKYGVYCSNQNGTNIVIISNNINSANFGVYGAYLNNVDIKSNIFTDLILNPSDTVGAGVGIYCATESSNASISENRIMSNGVYSLYINIASNVKINKNEISGDYAGTSYHVLITSGNIVDIVDNTISGNKYPIIVNTSVQVTAVNNNLIGSSTGVISLQNDSNSFSFNNKAVKVAESSTYTSETANTLEYTGVSVTIPVKSMYVITFIGKYTATPPVKCVVSNSSTSGTGRNVLLENDGTGICTIAGYSEAGMTLYFWCAWSPKGTNAVTAEGIIIR